MLVSHGRDCLSSRHIMKRRMSLKLRGYSRGRRGNVRRGPAPGQTYPIAVIPTVPAEHPPFIGNSHLLTGRRS
jgi:hypothetical protein